MKLVKWQSRIGLVVFVAGAALFGGSGLVIAQSPEPSGTASESPEARTPTPSTSEATSAAPMQVTFSIKAEVTDGRQQEIPAGSELVLRGKGGGLCARAALDTTAINAGSTVSGQDLVTTESKECGASGDALSVEILFPPGSSIGAIVLYPIAYEPGTTKALDIVIPAPIPVTDGDGNVDLPSTGQGTAGDSGAALKLGGVVLFAFGALLLAVRARGL